MRKILKTFSIVAIFGIFLGGLQFNQQTALSITYQTLSDENTANVIIVNNEDEWLDEGVDDLACLLTDGKYENRAW